MNMKSSTLKYLLGFFSCAALVCLTAATLAERANYQDGNELSRNAIVTDILTVDGTATIGTVAATAITAATSITNSGSYIAPFDTVSLTSPAVTVTAASVGTLQITTNVTQTGLIMTGGTVGQVVRILGTNDSATIQITDGTASMTLTGNLTLGLGDTATLLCTSTDGDEWSELSNAAN